MKIKPLKKRVLVKRCEAKTTKGGIILPDAAQEKPKEGEVVAVGPENKDVKVGDLVMFSSYAGTEVKDQQGEEEYLILSADDVLGILEGV